MNAAHLERRLNRIVRGQVRSFMHDHPGVITKHKRWSRDVIPNSLAKRIVPDILSVLLGARDRGGLAVTLPAAQVPAVVDTTATAGHHPESDR
jgi:hypothetical protein